MDIAVEKGLGNCHHHCRQADSRLVWMGMGSWSWVHIRWGYGPALRDCGWGITEITADRNGQLPPDSPSLSVLSLALADSTAA